MYNPSYTLDIRFREEQAREQARRQTVELRMRDAISNPHVPRCENPGCRAVRHDGDTICPECHYPYPQ